MYYLSRGSLFIGYQHSSSFFFFFGFHQKENQKIKNKKYSHLLFLYFYPKGPEGIFSRPQGHCNSQATAVSHQLDMSRVRGPNLTCGCIINRFQIQSMSRHHVKKYGEDA